MARKRIIDPEFWSDEEIGQWSFAARLFYIGLWNFADDEGKFKSANQLLKAQIFPYDIKIDISKLKKELNHKIQWYEVDGSQYGFIRNFLKYQRIDKPTKSKLPPVPSFDESSANTLGVLPPNISKDNISKDNIKEDKHLHHEFVLLTPEEYTKLISQFGQEGADDRISRLNEYAHQKPKKFKEYGSHYHTILAWSRKENVEVEDNLTKAQKSNLRGLKKLTEDLKNDKRIIPTGVCGIDRGVSGNKV
jgi:hypothetical protein